MSVRRPALLNHRAPLAWGLAITGLLLVGASLAMIAVGQPVPAYPAWFALAAYAVPLLLLGGLIWSRRPEERLGWIVLVEGLCTAVTLSAGEYATYAFLRSPGLPFAGGAAWISSFFQFGTIVGLVVIMFLFPTGRPVSPRWRPVGWALGIGSIGPLLETAIHAPKFDSNIDFIPNPVGILHPPAIVIAVKVIGTIVFGVGSSVPSRTSWFGSGGAKVISACR